MVKTEVTEMTLTKESVVLIAICAADLVVTLFLLGNHSAHEGNPLMGYYLRYGVGTFIMVKIILCSVPIFIFEWCRMYKPRFVKMMLRTTIALYLAIYASLFLVVNVGI